MADEVEDRESEEDAEYSNLDDDTKQMFLTAREQSQRIGQSVQKIKERDQQHERDVNAEVKINKEYAKAARAKLKLQQSLYDQREEVPLSWVQLMRARTPTIEQKFNQWPQSHLNLPFRSDIDTDDDADSRQSELFFPTHFQSRPQSTRSQIHHRRQPSGSRPQSTRSQMHHRRQSSGSRPVSARSYHRRQSSLFNFAQDDDTRSLIYSVANIDTGVYVQVDREVIQDADVIEDISIFKTFKDFCLQNKIIWQYSFATCWWRLFTAIFMLQNLKFKSKTKTVALVIGLINVTIFTVCFLKTYQFNFSNRLHLLISLMYLTFAVSIVVSLIFLYSLAQNNFPKSVKYTIGVLRMILVVVEIMFLLAVLRAVSPDAKTSTKVWKQIRRKGESVDENQPWEKILKSWIQLSDDLAYIIDDEEKITPIIEQTNKWAQEQNKNVTATEKANHAYILLWASYGELTDFK